MGKWFLITTDNHKGQKTKPADLSVMKSIFMQKTYGTILINNLDH